MHWDSKFRVQARRKVRIGKMQMPVSGLRFPLWEVCDFDEDPHVSLSFYLQWSEVHTLVSLCLTVPDSTLAVVISLWKLLDRAFLQSPQDWRKGRGWLAVQSFRVLPSLPSLRQNNQDKIFKLQPPPALCKCVNEGKKLSVCGDGGGEEWTVWRVFKSYLMKENKESTRKKNI